MTVKASDGSDRTSTVTSFSFYNPFITTLRVAAEVNIPILINLSNCNIVVLDFLLHLISIVNYNYTNIKGGGGGGGGGGGFSALIFVRTQF